MSENKRESRGIILKNIRALTYLKIIAFLFLLVVAIFYPKNMFDYILSDIAISLFGGKYIGLISKAISYLLHDKILLLIMGILGVFLFVIKEYKKSIFIFSTAFFGAAFALLFKNTIQRQRPLFEIFDGFSFPSGHATVAALFFFSLIFVINKKELLKTITPFALFAIALSRVAVGAHYITDVVAGLLLGSIVVDVLKVTYINIYTIFSNITGLEDGEK